MRSQPNFTLPVRIRADINLSALILTGTFSIMKPNAIQKLLKEAESLHSNSIDSSIHTVPAFLSSWVAWEALRTRFIRVVIHHQGWLLKDADKVLAKKKISSMLEAEKTISSLGLEHPHHWAGKSAKGWKALVEIEPLRHRLIHGFKSMEPVRVQAATKVVIRLVSDHDWLSAVPIVDAPKKKDRVVAGSLLEPKRSSRTVQNRSTQELADIMGVDLNCGTKPLPSLSRLEDVLSKL